MTIARSLIIALALLFCAPGLAAARDERAAHEAQTAAALEAVRDHPVKLRALLSTMPKGGELHTHLAGAVYAEDFIAWGAERDFCVDVENRAIAAGPCAGPRLAPLRGLEARDRPLYAALVDNLSVRGWLATRAGPAVTGHEAFFSSFARFGPISLREHARSLAAVRRAAAAENVSYLEIMHAPVVLASTMSDPGDSAFRADDLASAYDRLLPALQDLARRGPEETRTTDVEVDDLLGCRGAASQPACAVEVRYLCYALRTFSAAQVFRHLAQCFALAAADPRYVGINIVAPEDDPVALRDYTLHMRMIGFLRGKHPGVRISLHAGELTLGLAPLDALRTHIAEAIEIAGAERIGHGVAIAHETNSAATLARMAREKIAVEINLVSNDVILAVRGRDHPLALYRAAGVPFALSTDDQGVLRTDQTEQFVRAVTEQGLGYGDLKAAARNSLEYAFIEGGGLWADRPGGARVPACAALASPACEAFGSENARARLQIRLERALEAFEAETAAQGRPRRK